MKLAWDEIVKNVAFKGSPLNLFYFILRRSKLVGVYEPVSPDLAKTVNVRSDYNGNLANVFGGAKNGHCT